MMARWIKRDLALFHIVCSFFLKLFHPLGTFRLIFGTRLMYISQLEDRKGVRVEIYHPRSEMITITVATRTQVCIILVLHLHFCTAHCAQMSLFDFTVTMDFFHFQNNLITLQYK